MVEALPEPVDDIRLIRSHLIDDALFVHGFPERTGGHSPAPRSSLSLGFRDGHERDLVDANRRRVAEHAGFDIAGLVVAQPVHGVEVRYVDADLPDPVKLDGLVSDRPGVTTGALSADCIPMLFADPVARVCGSAHSGWRGTLNRIAANMVERMRALGSRPEDIRVALGPSIGPCCFEVGPEVVDAFREAHGALPGMIVPGPRRDHIDLHLVARTVLAQAGVDPAHIDGAPPCTKCDPARFFSYRRDGLGGGMHMSFIGLRATAA